MKNNNYNLIILHHEEVFATREDAMQYLVRQYQAVSLDGEPVIVKYGEQENPNVILAFGTSDASPMGSFYAIDMKKAEEQIENFSGDKEQLEYVAEILDGVVNATGLTVDNNKIDDKVSYEPDSRDDVIGSAVTIAEALDLLSKYTQKGLSDIELSVEDTDTIDLTYAENPNGGMILKGDVKVSTDGDSDDLTFNNNIIGVKADGIYAASNLTYDDVRHQLIFTTSGYKNGRFQDDAIVQRVDLGEHVNVEGGQTETIETIVNNVNNVATVTGNVKLGSTNSIVVRNGGLEANITVDVDAASNRLIVTIGNQTITKQLPGVELFESAEYNDANEELIITFRTGNTLVIPIHGIIHTWETSNSENSPITLTKTVVTGGVDTLSGTIKLRSTDNLIGIDGGKLYVSEQNINNKVNTETSRATNAEDVIRTSVQELQSDLSDLATALTTETTARQAKDVELATAIETAKRDAADDASEKADAAKDDANAYTDTQVSAEQARAEAAEAANASAISDAATLAENNTTAIQELETEVDDMKFVTNETDTVRMTMVKETGAETRVLSSDVKLKTISGENTNIIKSDANGLYATVSFSYDKATNNITFNNGNGDKVFELSNFGILQDAFYDSENKSLVLIVKKDDDTTERITIPVSDLVNTWSVENNANSPVVLTKEAGDDGDVLSAEISILNNENNLLVNDNGSLFVDGDSNAHKALWGNEVTSVQGVINIFWGVYNDIEQMKQDIADLQEDNENIKQTLGELEDDLDTQKERITTNENNIADLTERVETIETGLTELTENVNSFDSRITDAENNASEALEKVNELIETIGGGAQLIERIERIEEVLQELIDFGEYDIQL